MENSNNEMEVKKIENSEEASKISKNYDTTMKKLVAIVGGEENLLPKKRAKKDVIQNIVADLLKDDKEIFEKNIKQEMKDLLTKHIQLKKEIEAKKKELAKLEEDKKKEFNEAASKLFNKIDDLGKLESDYYDSLKSINK